MVVIGRESVSAFHFDNRAELIAHLSTLPTEGLQESLEAITRDIAFAQKHSYHATESILNEWRDIIVSLIEARKD